MDLYVNSNSFLVLTNLTFIVGVIVTNATNPTSFDNFTQAVPFFETTGEGPACFPLNLASTGISGLSDGANATLQFVFNGGDGTLYQVSLDITPPVHVTYLTTLLTVCRRRSKQHRYHPI